MDDQNLAPLDPIQTALADWHTYLKRAVEAGDLSATTATTYRTGMARFVEWHRSTAQPVTADSATAWKGVMLQAGHKPSSVNVWLAGARAFYAWAAATGRTLSNPLADVKGVKRKGVNRMHKRDRLTNTEVRRLLALDLPPRDRAYIALRLYTGIRDVEAHRADLADLRTRDGVKVLVIRGKGHAEADDFVKIPAACDDALAAWLAVRGTDPGPLFTSASDRSRGERLSLAAIRRIVKDAYRAAGITEATKTSHSLRHTAISQAIEKTRDPLRVKGMSRHASLDTLMIYWHESDRLTNAAEDAIDYSEGMK
jgi:site-specific recombinase XerD